MLKASKNILRQLCPQVTRLYAQSTNATLPEEEKSVILEPLTQRELIRVRGEEAFEFLQGLTTNDMKQLGRNTGVTRSMYSMFLNKNGRVLYDSIIYSVPEPNTYLIECDKQISNELRRLLRTYRVRRKIDIDPVDKDYTPWVVFDNKTHPKKYTDFLKKDTSICALGDPRLSELGMRIITPTEVTWADLSNHMRKNFYVNAQKASGHDNYTNQRYNTGIPEGVEDIPPGKYFPFEANGDLLNALSFDKGCYIGQELTARVYHTGVIRKRYMPLKLTVPLTDNKEIQTNAGARIGHVVASQGNKALALVRVEPALRATSFEIDGDPCYLEKPRWWPDHINGSTRATV